MTAVQAFIGMGANASEPAARLQAALAGLDADGARVAACARPRWTPFEGGRGDAVLNTVAEVRTTWSPSALLDRMQALEAEAGRDRSAGGPARTLDLDLLAYGQERIDGPGLSVPHPRALQRGFVLGPWAEIAPTFVVAGHPVIRWRASLDARAFEGHRIEDSLPFANRDGEPVVLEDRAALDAWRASRSGTVGVVPTMGALHRGHASLAQRAAAECDHVVATVFVNPLQFAPGEDLDRYPRTFDADVALLAHHGVGAVYAPAPADLYASDFSTFVVPRDMADRYEGASRPTHFEGVTTIVTKLLNRVRADVAYFAHKDAQQLAIVRRLHRDLDLPGTLRDCPTVHEGSGLALSSRNRYLSDEQRARALGLSRALCAVRAAAAAGTADVDTLRRAASDVLAAHDLQVDYADVVDPESFVAPQTLGNAPALAIAAVRVGKTRLLDNRWVSLPRDAATTGDAHAGSP